MKAKICTQLKEIETTENIRIFYACESGSRAWGFPSTDSDYDVRFLYVRPVDWYLSIDEKRDVIEQPTAGILDIIGWDFKKSLKLFRKSNPPLVEWLGSPMVYLEEYTLAAQMRSLLPIYYSPTACLYHYLHMARGNYREYLKGAEVWVKKYFYVLRPILAVNWIERGLGVVPMDFHVLVEKLVTQAELRVEIAKLLAAKCQGAELDRGPRIVAIADFIESELARLESKQAHHEKTALPDEKLDALFRAGIVEVWK